MMKLYFNNIYSS